MQKIGRPITSAMAAGSLGTLISRTTTPVASTTQMLVSLTDTSSPMKCSMATLLLLMLEAANARPRFTISLKRSTQNLPAIHKLAGP